ncbi:MAG: ROK family protein [Lachnospiraceae bacterium]|nr:ROK family protein [Lachnospiraceae bacterium]
MVTRLPELFGGLEISGSEMVCALGYADGAITDRISFPTTEPADSIPKIIDYFKDKKIRALGIGSFGPVDVNPDSKTYGTILESPKLPWQHYPLKKVLEEALNVPIKVDSAANGSCLGEMTFGCAEGIDNVGYVTVGTGIGAGMAVNGQLVHGMGHPEFGHILVSRIEGDDYKGKCPFHPNCVESLASGPAIEERWGSRAEDLSDRPEVWEMEADYISQALMSMVLTISPRKIILSGGVMRQQQLFPLIRKKLIEKLAGYIHTGEIEDIDNYVVPASLSDDQGIKGAIQLGVLAALK